MHRALCILTVLLLTLLPTTLHADDHFPTRPATQEGLEAFFTDWFTALDADAPLEQLLPHVAAEGFQMNVLGNPFAGREGFQQWHAGTAQSVQSATHEPLELEITEAEGGSFNVDFRLRWKAVFASGQPFEAVYKEHWQVRHDGERWVISEYVVAPDA